MRCLARRPATPRNPARSRRLWAALAGIATTGVLVSPLPVNATTQHLRSDDPEAWAMFYFTSATLFSGLGTPRAREPWSVELALELGNIPYLSTQERTVGFDGTKVENLNNSPVLARPILTIGLPWRMSLSLAYIPPVRVFSVKPNLFAMAIERPLLESGPWTLGARLHGQVGKSEGPFTCPGYAVKYAPGTDGNPYGCNERSDDRAIQNYVGLELSGSYRVDSLHGLTPYLTLGANYLNTEFHVRAQTFGEIDRTQLAADTWTFSLGAGFGIPMTENTWFSLGVFYTPLQVDREPPASHEEDGFVNARAELSYKLW